jgi:hypothetical protein
MPPAASARRRRRLDVFASLTALAAVLSACGSDPVGIAPAERPRAAVAGGASQGGPHVFLVSPAGGTFSTPETAAGGVTMTVPAGAFAETTSLTAQPVAPAFADPLLVPGAVYELGPGGTLLPPDRSLTVTITYDEVAVARLDEHRLRLHVARTDAAGGVVGWEEADAGSVDVARHAVTGRVRRLSQVAARGPSPVASVEVTPAEVTLDGAGGRTTAELSATPRDAAGAALRDRDVAWESSDPLIAAVDQRGVVTARGTGTAVVTATSEGVSARATVRVRLPADAAAADFSATSNPSGPWRAGWTATLGGALRLYPEVQRGRWFVRWLDGSINRAQTPNFAKNVAADGWLLFGSLPGEVSLHPGCNAGELSVLRWTAPAAGTYHVRAQFFAGDGVVGLYGETTAHVLVNGQAATPLFHAAVTSTDPAFSRTMTLEAQEFLDFVVGPGADGCAADTTPLAVTVARLR